MEKLGSTEKRRSDTFDATKEAIGRVYETICCSLVSQRCVCSSISRGTIRKLGGGKIKGNQWRPTFRPDFIVRPVSFIIFLDLVHAVPISSLSPLRSGSRSSSTVTTSRRLTRFLRRFGSGICHSSGLKHEKCEKHEYFQPR